MGNLAVFLVVSCTGSLNEQVTIFGLHLSVFSLSVVKSWVTLWRLQTWPWLSLSTCVPTFPRRWVCIASGLWTRGLSLALAESRIFNTKEWCGKWSFFYLRKTNKASDIFKLMQQGKVSDSWNFKHLYSQLVALLLQWVQTKLILSELVLAIKNKKNFAILLIVCT